MPKWLLVIPLLLMLIPIGLIAHVWYRDYQRHIELYGPDPAYVDYETNLGSGYMMVRDVKNAEAEVKKHMEETWDWICSTNTGKLEVKGKVPPLQIKKITVRNRL